MTKRAKLIFFAITPVLLAIAALASFFLISCLMNLDTYRSQILSMAEKSLGRRVSYRTGSFSWRNGPAFVFTDVAVLEKGNRGTLMSCQRLDFRLAVVPLLYKEIRTSGITLESPVISLGRDKAGVFNISDLLRAKPGAYKLEVKDVRIKNGIVHFADRMPGYEGFAASLENIDLYLNGIARGGTSIFNLSAALAGAGERAQIACSGKAEIPPEGKPPGGTSLDLALTVKNLDAWRYWPYYGRRLPFDRIRATVDCDCVFRGTPAEFNSRGSFVARGLRFSYPGVFHGALTPRNLRLSYDMGLSPRKLSVNSLDLALDGLRVKGGCSIADPHGKDPFIRARAATSPFNLADTRQYIPYGIIPKDTSEFIEKHITGGVYRLDSGVLEGRLSRILHMEKDRNYNVLSIRGTVEKGVVSFGRENPAFNNIKGELEMRGKDFILRRMSGRFGGSPFTLDGKITDYPLAIPCGYPFSMTITPGHAEIAWLLPGEKGRRTVFRGPSVLLLEGSGTTADYRLKGDWNLDGAEYAYPEVLHKRAGLENRLKFGLVLRKTEAELTELSYHAPPLSLMASAKYRYGNREPLSLAVTINRFHVDTSTPLFPGLQRYRPAGMLQMSVSGRGNPEEPDSMQWSGNLSVAGFSFQHHLPIDQLSQINGSIIIHGHSLETERITADLGSSPFSVSGWLSGFSNPSADLAVSSPFLRLRDLGFQATGGEVEVKNLSGNIRLKDKNVTVASLSGKVKSSSFLINGNVANIENPRIGMDARFSFLKVEDLLPLARLKRSGEKKGAPGIPPVEARIACERGTFRDIPFRKLDAELSLDHKNLLVRSLKTGVFSGKVSATGVADFAAAEGADFHARFRLEHLDLAQIDRAAGFGLPVGGFLSAGGELACRGKNMDELERTARGSADADLTSVMLRLEAQPGQKKPREVYFKKV
ncbi:MAG TPA: DUF748 domain-containing protein, partial [Geobacteraceae bacterium]|nr:DUF748 domain-containing protein [Geobacteraceae bacterium]